METQWICTDSDKEQYGRQISKKIFEFKQKADDEDEYDIGEYIEITINLNHYTEEQIENHINSYGYTLYEPKGHTFTGVNIFELYGEQSDWIIAECIFEQESGLY